MSKYLPYGGFKWVKPELFNASNILEMKDNQEKGYLFEVDLIYLKELHKNIMIYHTVQKI